MSSLPDMNRGASRCVHGGGAGRSCGSEDEHLLVVGPRAARVAFSEVHRHDRCCTGFCVVCQHVGRGGGESSSSTDRFVVPEVECSTFLYEA